MLLKISKPYLIAVSERARLAGFIDSRFKTKREAKNFVQLVRVVDPSFNPSLRALFRYYDSATGTLYATRADYQLEQERAKAWRDRKNDA